MARTQESYNDYEALPKMAYNCVKYLMDNNELLFRLLKYNDKDAWQLDSDHPNLTKVEKGDLIYSGGADDTSKRIFTSIGNDTAWTHEASILRIAPLTINPSNYVVGKVTMAFEVYVHYKTIHLSNYQNKVDLIIQQLLKELNGAEIGGIGRLSFDENGRNRVIRIGKVPYKGKALTMTNWEAN